VTAPFVVVGGGFAGLAAGWALASAGEHVLLLEHRPGSSELYSGVLSGAPDPGVAVERAAFLKELSLFGDTTGAVCATWEGGVKSVVASAGALLELDRLAGKHIVLADVGRQDWDAHRLALALGAEPWSRLTGTRFSAVPVSGLRYAAEAAISGHDFAALHDDSERLAWLTTRLQRAEAEADAWLLGPWLGIATESRPRLEEELGVPAGEVSSPPGGAAGARFQVKKQRLAESLRLERLTAELLAVEVDAQGVHLQLQHERAPRFARDASGVVLATGGVAAGGIVLEGGLGGGEPPSFRLAYQLPFDALLRSKALAAGWLEDVRELERIGVDAGRLEALSAGRVVAAGDLLAGGRHDVAFAIDSGLRAALALLELRGRRSAG
jgi:anaerobic glycerol-3-phosphate dehydrogenase